MIPTLNFSPLKNCSLFSVSFYILCILALQGFIYLQTFFLYIANFSLIWGIFSDASNFFPCRLEIFSKIARIFFFFLIKVFLGVWKFILGFIARFYKSTFRYFLLGFGIFWASEKLPSFHKQYFKAREIFLDLKN